jgi:hypothetical protein
MYHTCMKRLFHEELIRKANDFGKKRLQLVFT